MQHMITDTIRKKAVMFTKPTASFNKGKAWILPWHLVMFTRWKASTNTDMVWNLHTYISVVIFNRYKVYFTNTLIRVLVTFTKCSISYNKVMHSNLYWPASNIYFCNVASNTVQVKAMVTFTRSTDYFTKHRPMVCSSIY